jgi:general secretion pathway protein J
MPRVAHCSGDAGFTLLELLVGLVLLGLLASVLAGSLTFGRRAWEAGEDAFARNGDLRLVQGFLRERFAAAPRFTTADTDAGVGFDGRAESVTFLTGVSTTVGSRMLTVGIANIGSARDLVMMQAPVGPTAESGTQRVLLKGVQDVRFAYFGALPQDEDARWHPTWKDGGRLPLLVRMRIAFDDQRRHWPDLVAALPVTGDPACLVDASAPQCRRR